MRNLTDIIMRIYLGEIIGMQLRCDLTFICLQKVLTFAASYVVGNSHFFPKKKLSKVNSLELNK